jgi:vacuolar-type H+-ATPase subunit H
VARTRDLLRRFRLTAVPGKAGIAGVPVDHAAVLREELAPVFAALRATESRTSDIVSRATAEGESRKASAALEAQRILHQASQAQSGARAGAAATAQSEATAAGSELRGSADEEVERINREATMKIMPVVDELVRRVLSSSVASKTSP